MQQHGWPILPPRCAVHAPQNAASYCQRVRFGHVLHLTNCWRTSWRCAWLPQCYRGNTGRACAAMAISPASFADLRFEITRFRFTPSTKSSAIAKQNACSECCKAMLAPGKNAVALWAMQNTWKLGRRPRLAPAGVLARHIMRHQSDVAPDIEIGLLRPGRGSANAKTCRHSSLV